MAGEDSIRIFLALPLNQLYAAEIQQFIDTYRERIPDVKWVRAEAVHITLHFFGSIPRAFLDPIREAARATARAHAPFDINLENVGFFPDDRHPRVMWLGMANGTERVAALQGHLEEILLKAGFQAEERVFRPHGTVGRLRAGARVAERPAFKATPVRVMDRLALFHSCLTPEGARYEILDSFPLSQSPSA